MGKVLFCLTLVLVLSSYVSSIDDGENSSPIDSVVPSSTESTYSTTFADKVFSTSDVSVDKVSTTFFRKVFLSSIFPRSFATGSYISTRSHSTAVRESTTQFRSTSQFPSSSQFRSTTQFPSSTQFRSTTQFPSTSVTVTCPTPIPFPKPVDCEEVRKNGHNKSGIYTVWPRSRIGHCSLVVYCDMDTAGGGWTVIQRRGKFGGPMNFFHKTWEHYKNGFGFLDQEFWLGNDNIFALTNQGPYTVRFDLTKRNDIRAYALYDTFWIDDEVEKYKLHINGYSGTAGDSMAYHNGMYFSTRDRDNDRSSYYNCAKDRSSAWWFNYCMESNLNGLYRDGYYYAEYNDGIDWHKFGGYKNSLVATEIKIRPRNACRRRPPLRTSTDP